LEDVFRLELIERVRLHPRVTHHAVPVEDEVGALGEGPSRRWARVGFSFVFTANRPNDAVEISVRAPDGAVTRIDRRGSVVAR
jgi:hypothetical protein